MKTISEYLDDAKRKTGSDGKTAELLQVSRQAVSNYRKRESMGAEQAAILAEFLGVDFKAVVAACEVGRDPSRWEFWSKRVAGFAILAVGIMAISLENSESYVHGATGVLYIIRSCGFFYG